MSTTRSEPTGTSSRDFSKDEVYDAVKNLRRRYVLYHLNERGRPVQLGELAEQVAAWENNIAIEDVSPEQRKSVYSALYQTHLPKLEEIGIVSYDRHSKEVSFTDSAQDFELYLANDSGTTLPWHRFYLLLSGLGGTLVAATWIGVLTVSSLAVTTVLLGLFATTALAHVYDRYCWQRRFRGTTPDFALEFGDRRWFR
ncbi:DUF7344 domain-containing protein [Halomicrococcus sp. SG-WS-1]|uniref:DUF7344 domain-containing protein n=1 Tax=Halomicrococcus sp. SG-WS-1 TaxID=3439057 RepID=UPI003F7A900F